MRNARGCSSDNVFRGIYLRRVWITRDLWSHGKTSLDRSYIFTRLMPYTRGVFNELDDNILEYNNEEGQWIEPKHYVPIIPMVLVNGADGNEPCFLFSTRSAARVRESRSDTVTAKPAFGRAPYA